MPIQENIRALRKEKNLTQEALAEAMGVSCAAVSKWEKGQCAPDLSTLTALADYFQVSVDAMLDHHVKADRQEAMLAQLNEALDSRETERAASVCRALLRSYPNSPEAVDACAEAYYALAICTMDDRYMEQCIEQTKRMFTLKKGEREVDKLRRLGSLASQYEHMQQWEKAKECYEQCNVSGSHEGDIARCLLALGRSEEALMLVSDNIALDLDRLHSKLSTLSRIWEKEERLDLALQGLEWILDIMERIRFNSPTQHVLFLQIAALHLQLGNRADAEAAIRRAEAFGDSIPKEHQVEVPFLRTSKPRKVLVSTSLGDVQTALAAAVAEMRPRGVQMQIHVDLSDQKNM